MGSVRSVAAIAFALGLVLLFSVVTLVLFFAVGGPFGALNDWSIGASCVLAVAFVFAIRASGLGRSSVGGLIPPLAVLGAALVVVGAWLVISDTTQRGRQDVTFTVSGYV